METREWLASASGAPPTRPVAPSVGHPQGGVTPSKPGAYWYHQISEELRGLLLGAGLVPDATTLTQIKSAIEVMVRKQVGVVGVTTGTADAIVVTYTPVAAALTDGLKVVFNATAANTSTTPTCNSDGLGVRTIVKGNNLPLVVGDIPGAGATVHLQYDITLNKYLLMNPAFGISTGATVSSSVLTGSAVALATNVFSNVTSISLSPGDWDVCGVVLFKGPGGPVTEGLACSISTTTATPLSPNISRFSYNPVAWVTDQAMPLPTTRLTLASTTTIYLVAAATFSTAGIGAYGSISARRIK